MKNIAIFVSGNGSNCENIIRHFASSQYARVTLVLSNKKDAYALTRAQKHGISTEVMPKNDFACREKILPLLEKYNADIIILAGFLLIIPDFIIKRYNRRIINIHPSLLPKFGGKGMYGMNVHKAVKESKEKETGMTVHYVNEECDGGEIIAQFRTPLTGMESIEEIAEKEQELEQKHFPAVIEEVIRNTFTEN